MAQSLGHAAATPDAPPRNGRIQTVCHQRPVCGHDPSVKNSASARRYIRLEQDHTVTVSQGSTDSEETFIFDYATGADPTTYSQESLYSEVCLHYSSIIDILSYLLSRWLVRLHIVRPP